VGAGEGAGAGRMAIDALLAPSDALLAPSGEGADGCAPTEGVAKFVEGSARQDWLGGTLGVPSATRVVPSGGGAGVGAAGSVGGVKVLSAGGGGADLGGVRVVSGGGCTIGGVKVITSGHAAAPPAPVLAHPLGAGARGGGSGGWGAGSDKAEARVGGMRVVSSASAVESRSPVLGAPPERDPKRARLALPF